jgi:hypothetical protein
MHWMPKACLPRIVHSALQASILQFAVACITALAPTALHFADLTLFCCRCALPYCAAADMRSDVQAIFKETPHDKQVMMFSATMAKEIRTVCKKFMNKVRSCAGQARIACYAAPHDLSLLAAVAASSALAAAVVAMALCQCLSQQWQAQHQRPRQHRPPCTVCSVVLAG